jgi:2-polyprenyl-3-methyl-5-hydroxy-6-metoxy-1,4-benzoquinol methylase
MIINEVYMNTEDNNKIFENYLTNHYSSCDGIDFKVDDQVLALLNKNKKVIDHNLGGFFNKKVQKNFNILDLGCGYGSFLFFLQSNGYKNVAAVDLSSEEIDICKRFFKSYQFYKEDIFKFINDTQEKFDVIYMSHVLEHIKKENLFAFLEGVKKILKDDGIFVIIVPNSAAYFNSAANRYGDLTHEIGFTDLSLRQALKVANFSNIELKNYTGISNLGVKIIRKFSLFLFGIFLKILGYDEQEIYTPSILAIAKK